MLLLASPRARAIAGCVLLAALSLLLPSAPTYDPWAWILWGREVAELDLDTVDGPSWKPLPVLFTAPFSLLGGAAPDLWLVVARAGGLLGLVLAWVIARRLAGVVAGAAAFGTLALAPWYYKNAFLGNSEGLMAAVVLGAIERHGAGDRRAAFGLGLAAALLRPEAWPFFGLYGLWLAWQERERILLVAAGYAALPVLWLGPELWGSGNALRASDRAQKPNAGSAAFAENPAREVVDNTLEILTTPVTVGLLLALAAVLVARDRVGRTPALAVAGIAVMGLTWTAIVAVMTSDGFSGNQRYLVMPVVLLSVAGACGLGWLASAVLRDRRALGALAVLACVGATAPWWGQTQTTVDGLAYQGRLHQQLSDVIEQAGGKTAVLGCGPAVTGAFLTQTVAWHLGVHGRQVLLEPAVGTAVLRVRTNPGSQAVPPFGAASDAPQRTLARSRDWRIVCAGG